MHEYINVTINISDDCIIIPKTQYNELINNYLSGTWWSMRDLESITGRDYLWITETILLNPRWRNNLDVDNGGFVWYPSKGEKWAFIAARMAKFLNDNFKDIVKESRIISHSKRKAKKGA